MEVDKTKNKESILIICLGFIGLFLMSSKLPFLYIAFIVGVLSFLSKWIEDKVVWFWFRIGHVLGWINSKILLSILFVLMIVPFAFVKKLFGKKSINLSKSDDSYYKIREHIYTKKDLENIW